MEEASDPISSSVPASEVGEDQNPSLNTQPTEDEIRWFYQEARVEKCIKSEYQHEIRILVLL